METIQSTVIKSIYTNDSGFKVLSTRTVAGKHLIITGEFGPEVISETIASFHGNFTTHAKYGHQFKSKAYTLIHNAQELSSIKIFLNNIAEFVGPERSESLISMFGTNTFNIIENSPERLLEVPGIGKIIKENIVKAWQENRQKWVAEKTIYSLRAFLMSLGIKEKRIRKVLAHFSTHEYDAEQAIRENPYSLIEIDSFGFSTVDFIARQLGTPEESPERLKAFLLYLIEVECPQSGHLFLTLQEILECIEVFINQNNSRFLGRAINEEDIIKYIDPLIKSERLLFDGGVRFYAKKQYDFEIKSAQLLVNIMEKPSDLIFLNDEKIRDFIDVFEHENGITLSEDQRKALYYFAEKKVFVITGLPGSGKCLGKDTPVMMFDGTIKKVQDIKVGDNLMGDDSLPRTVLSTCSGIEELYRVNPTKGDPYIVNKSHILSLKKTGTNNVYDINIMDYLKIGQRVRYKGYKVPLSFSEKPIPVDPYLLGYWLGNGESEDTGISTPYPEILNHLSKIIEKIGLTIKKDKGDNYDYRLTCVRGSAHYENLANKKYPNEFMNALKNLNLIKNKHIPLIYKTNSREIRLKLLAGLLDSDGFYNERGNEFEFSQKSKTLTDDVCFLVRSLGFCTYPKLRRKKWNSFSKGKRYIGESDYYIMCISGPGLENIPTVIEKKKARPRKQIKNVLLTGIKIEPLGIGDYYGFEINGNGRFLLGDFTVTHNTTLLRAVVHLAQHLGLDLTCMTPTGISAKKLSRTIDYDAYTVHRRLGFQGDAWTYNEINQFHTDVVIIDEISMIDQEVFYRLLSALRPRTHLIFVGDHNQLPSVGAGNVLKELIECNQIPVITLDKIFRQHGTSEIIEATHRIIKGDTNLELFKDDPTADIYFMRITKPQDIEPVVVALAQKFKDEDPPRLFQILSPRNTGPLGIESLNQILQGALNPPAPHLNEIKFNDNDIIRKGDRVIVKKNDYKNEIYNGDIGKVTNIAAGMISIKIEDRIIELPVDEIKEKIKLAYSLTVHNSQGQEYPLVILMFINQFGKNMLQRNLLYTAMTRAKKKVIVIGHGSAIEKAINNTAIIKRNTILGERIKLCLDQKRNPSLLGPQWEPEASQGL